jgi:hypothetical protein
VRSYDLERELARANTEHNAQRAAAEQRAREAELLVAAQREQVEALTAHRQQQEELLEAQTISLTQANALVEGQGAAILHAETALRAARAEIDQGWKHVEGTCLLDSAYLAFVETHLLFLLRAAEGGGRRDRGEGGPLGHEHIRSKGLRRPGGNRHGRVPSSRG